MTHTAVLFALLASLFLLIVPIAALTRGVVDGFRGWSRSPQAARIAPRPLPRRRPRRG